MGKKIKLCKLVKKDMLDDNLKDYLELVNDPHYICTKCGRLANKSEYVCKDKKLP